MDDARPDPFGPEARRIAGAVAARFLRTLRVPLRNLIRDDVYHEAEVGVWVASRHFRPDGGARWTTFAYAGALKRVRGFARTMDQQARVARTNYQRARRGDPARVPVPVIDSVGKYARFDAADPRPPAGDLAELLEWLDARLARLPPRDAAIAARCLRDGESGRAVARAVGLSEQRVGQVVAAARRELADRYAEVV